MRDIREKFWRGMERGGLPRLLHLWYGGFATILTFHRLVESSGSATLSENFRRELAPDLLIATLRYFTDRGYQVVSLDEMTRRLQARETAQKVVTITFDDGYRDTLTVAQPVLSRLGYPFTVFVPSGLPDGLTVPWWYLLDDVIDMRDGIDLNWKGERIELPTGTVLEKEAAFMRLKRLFLHTAPAELRELAAQLCAEAKRASDFYSQRLSLSWDDIRKLAGDPAVTIGAQGIHLVPLSHLDDKVALAEIIGSKNRLEEELARPISHFAYPFGGRGSAGRREFRIAQEVGFLTAVTSRLGNVMPAHRKHLTALPRVPVLPGALPERELAHRVTGFGAFRTRQFNRLVTE